MNATQAQVVYAAARELILEHPEHGFDLDRCPNCGMDSGTIAGSGEIEHGLRWALVCNVCGGTMVPITEDALVRYMDIVCSILGHAHLRERGAFS